MLKMNSLLIWYMIKRMWISLALYSTYKLQMHWMLRRSANTHHYLKLPFKTLREFHSPSEKVKTQSLVFSPPPILSNLPLSPTFCASPPYPRLSPSYSIMRFMGTGIMTYSSIFLTNISSTLSNISEVNYHFPSTKDSYTKWQKLHSDFSCRYFHMCLVFYIT